MGGALSDAKAVWIGLRGSSPDPRPEAVGRLTKAIITAPLVSLITQAPAALSAPPPAPVNAEVYPIAETSGSYTTPKSPFPGIHVIRQPRAPASTDTHALPRHPRAGPAAGPPRPRPRRRPRQAGFQQEPIHITRLGTRAERWVIAGGRPGARRNTATRRGYIPGRNARQGRPRHLCAHDGPGNRTLMRAKMVRPGRAGLCGNSGHRGHTGRGSRPGFRGRLRGRARARGERALAATPSGGRRRPAPAGAARRRSPPGRGGAPRAPGRTRDIRPR
jgi:hypothetical protein